jgi:hypothetical protein
VASQEKSAIESLKQWLKEAKAGKCYSLTDVFSEEQRGVFVSGSKR